MNAPSVHIVLQFENPKAIIYADVFRESEKVRLDDWIRAHPRLLELVERATELARDERAA